MICQSGLNLGHTSLRDVILSDWLLVPGNTDCQKGSKIYLVSRMPFKWGMQYKDSQNLPKMTVSAHCLTWKSDCRCRCPNYYADPYYFSLLTRWFQTWRNSASACMMSGIRVRTRERKETALQIISIQSLKMVYSWIARHVSDILEISHKVNNILVNVLIDWVFWVLTTVIIP